MSRVLFQPPGLSLLMAFLLLGCGPQGGGTEPAAVPEMTAVSDMTADSEMLAVPPLDSASAASKTDVQAHPPVPAGQERPPSDNSPAQARVVVEPTPVDTPSDLPDNSTTAVVSDHYQPLKDVRSLQTADAPKRQSLDLTLPAMNWDDDSESRDFSSPRMPDVFRYQKAESSMNLSGKLHWDEAEEATRVKLEESIKGAEVELQFRLP